MESTSLGPMDRGAKLTCTDELSAGQIQSTVEDVLAGTRFIDMHTHLFPPAFGRLGLWGIDELLTYHYLEAEFFRSSDFTHEQYWSLSKRERADAIWRTLFVENSPVSEATRGVVAVLTALDLPADSPDLAEARSFFAAQSVSEHVGRVFEIAGVERVVMTNDPLDPDESPAWMNGTKPDPKFQAVLRLDRILRGWSQNWQTLAAQGYNVDADAGRKSIAEVRRSSRTGADACVPCTWRFHYPIHFGFPMRVWPASY